jgi:hypothetical protein
MKDTGWIKLWRSLKDNPVMYDDKASRVLLWLFLLVDKTTGELEFGRYSLAREIKINDNTLYKVLKRLEKKYEIVTMSSNNQYTTIRFINWAKYQASKDTVTGTSNTQRNNNVTTEEQQSNTITRNKEYKNKEDILSDKPKVSKTYERLPEEKQQLLHRVAYYLEDTLDTKIVNWGKAAKAVAMMQKAGYTEAQIKWTIKEMVKEEFYQDKGFDLMTVANNIDKYKAKARKALYVLPETN